MVTLNAAITSPRKYPRIIRDPSPKRPIRIAPEIKAPLYALSIEIPKPIYTQLRRQALDQNILVPELLTKIIRDAL
jgi:hypothetical protein